MQGHEGRLARVREEAARRRLDALLITSPPNIFYLTAFRGILSGDARAALLVAQDAAELLVDFRYFEEAQEQATVEVRRWDDVILAGIAGAARQRGWLRLGFEDRHLTVQSHAELRKQVPGVKLVRSSGVVERLRVRKDVEEVAAIRRAAAIAERALGEVLPEVRIGMSEAEVALRLEVALKRHRAEKASFDIIVAAGPDSALPHAQASAKPIEEGDLVLIDLGARCEGYCSDMTRMAIAGRGGRRHLELFHAVQVAQTSALRAVAAGASFREVQAVASAELDRWGLAKFFGHAVGHGVGIEIHEAPTPGASDDRLETGMMITVEPGAYVSGFGGVRIEDLVLVTEDGYDLLTRFPRELVEL